MGYWSTIEVHTGVVCACLPAISSLFRRIMDSSKGNRVSFDGRLVQRDGKDGSSIHTQNPSLELTDMNSISDASM